MAAENEVEIRFRVTEDKSSAPAAATTPNKATLTATTAPNSLTQNERDQERRAHKVHEAHSQMERFEHRIEHKLKHIGSRLVAAQLVEEGADLLGIGHSFTTRLGEHAIEGFMMGGVQGAALKSVMAIVHQLAEIIKGHGEDLKKIRERAVERENEEKDRAIELRQETRTKQSEMEEQLREALIEFDTRVRTEILNVQRYVTVPYLGRG